MLEETWNKNKLEILSIKISKKSLRTDILSNNDFNKSYKKFKYINYIK